MEPVAVQDMLVIIFYGHFVLRDQWCDAGDDGESLTASRGQVAAASTYQLTVQALSHTARLTLRVWDSEPAPDGDAWDGRRELALHCPTGDLVVDQITAGSRPAVTLPAGEGVYSMRVHWKHRERARTAIMETYERHRDRPFEDLTAALKELDGTEHFLVDAWRQGPLPPGDDDDDDFY